MVCNYTQVPIGLIFDIYVGWALPTVGGLVVSGHQNAVNGYGLIYDARTIIGNSGC